MNEIASYIVFWYTCEEGVYKYHSNECETMKQARQKLTNLLRDVDASSIGVRPIFA